MIWSEIGIKLTLNNFLAFSWLNLFHFPLILLKYFFCFKLSVFLVFFDIFRETKTRSDSDSSVTGKVSVIPTSGSTSKSGNLEPEAEFSTIDSESIRSNIVDSVGDVLVNSDELSVGLSSVVVNAAFDWYGTVALISSKPIFSLISNELFFCRSVGLFQFGVQYIILYDLKWPWTPFP